LNTKPKSEIFRKEINYKSNNKIMFTKNGVGSVPLKRNLHVGMIGEDVQEHQALLNALGVTDSPLAQSNLGEIEADGSFGSRTQMRVKEFQSRNNLTADGVIGPQTDTQMDALWVDYMQRHSDVFQSANTQN
jgi:peptidoglycan hydrolase-like protein with peptidoglycan-binding domain